MHHQVDLDFWTHRASAAARELKEKAAALGPAGPWETKEHPDGWDVIDATGNPVAVGIKKDLAHLVASIPDTLNLVSLALEGEGYSRGDRQRRAATWAMDCFGQTAMSHAERCRRFAEEACELLQSIGMSLADLLMVALYAYKRPPGEPKQEVGGTLVSLMCLCEHLNISMDEAEKAELSRVLSISSEKWRAKHQSKVEAGVAE